MSTIHALKTWPEYFAAIVAGEKTFEVRKNDRDFQTGDVVVLQEWDPETEEPTFEARAFTIGYVLPLSAFGADDDRVAFSLLPLDLSPQEIA